MNHLPYILASYAIFAAATVAVAASAGFRLRAAARRLRALDNRSVSP
jgi:hypothetical protein